jgi:hypothetical protein
VENFKKNEYILEMHSKEHLTVLGLCRGILSATDKLHASEKKILDSIPSEFVPDKKGQRLIRTAIENGEDPLGDLFMKVSSETRRKLGAVYTPHAIVKSMTDWIKSNSNPSRIIDPGSGSGRYIIEAGKIFPTSKLVAIEIDPTASIVLRANLTVHGIQDRCTVLLNDYREIEIDSISGQTAFIGNPPYVRHHDIDAKWKQWYLTSFKKLGIKASGLSGLHLHFFLKTLLLAKSGDIGAFITSAEWLDVNYGSSLREAFFEKLGGVGLHVLSPEIEAFPGTATTAAISCFKVGSKQNSVQARHVSSLSQINGLSKGRRIAHSEMPVSSKWSILIRDGKAIPSAGIRLGEIFRVHRGQVTGANHIWITKNNEFRLPDSVLMPAVTRAKELIDAGEVLADASHLKRVISLPMDLSIFSKADLRKVREFIRYAESQEADKGFVARHRRVWWSVKMREPAPILCTYMARRPPQFTLNTACAHNVNIAHGLYPIADVSPEEMAIFCRKLNEISDFNHGRQYAGGLLKFEPTEIENLTIPNELKVNHV